MIHKLLPTTLTLAAAGLAAGCSSADKPSDKQPNVIIILADDLGLGDISAYGATSLSTPNFDRIANGGLRFTNGYATSATSTPSRYAMLTGEYPWRLNLSVLPGDAPLMIGSDSPTLGKMFGTAGYTTGAVGKWHLGLGAGNTDWNAPISPSLSDIGFDYSYIMAATNDRVPCVYVRNGVVDRLDPADPILVNYQTNFEGEPTGRDNPELLKMRASHGHNFSIINGVGRIGYMKGGTAARWVDEDMAEIFMDEALDFVEQNVDNPFFLYYGLHQPHVPRVPNEQFVGKSGLGPRGDAILEADWCVGKLLDKLAELGIADNTLIVFTSDNGAVLDDGYVDQAVELNGTHSPWGGMRGGKYSLLEGGTHVPMMVMWPSKVKPGVSPAIVSQLDYLASLASIVGGDGNSVDSQNHADALLGISEIGRTSTVIEAMGSLGIRSGDYIMIPPHEGPALMKEVNIETGISPEYQLYNIAKDPQQQNNIAADNPDKVIAMETELKAVRDRK